MKIRFRPRIAIPALLALLMLLTVDVSAQSVAYAIPVKGPAVMVAPQRLGVLRDLPFVGTLQVDALPGIATTNGAPALGLALSKAFPLGKDLDVWIGMHAVVVQTVPASFGLYVGFGWRLGT